MPASTSSLAYDITALRIIGWIEAISFLFLLGVAMPLKYGFDQPIYVEVGGMLHGVLFLLFVGCLAVIGSLRKFSYLVFGKCLLGSVLPFGPLLYDPALKAWPLQRGPAMESAN